jgi:hypothetical protein
VIYVGVSENAQSLYKSTDAGATWTLVPNLPSTSTVTYSTTWGQPTAILPHHAVFDASGNLYVVFCSAAGPNDIAWGGVYKLNTSTSVWTDVSPSHAYQGGYGGLSINTTSGYLAVGTLDRWTDGDRVYISADGGTTWKDERSSASLDFTDAPWMQWHTSGSLASWHWIGTVAMDPQDANHILFGGGEGIWGTADALNAITSKAVDWSNAYSDGIEEIDGYRFYDFDESPRDSNFFTPAYGTSTAIDFAELTPTYIVRTHNSGTTAGSYSTDGGTTWNLFASQPTGIQTYGAGDIAVAADASTIVWNGQYMTPYYSTNNGSTWTASTGLPALSGSWETLPLASDRVNAKKFYVLDIASGKIYASTDAGKTFAATAGSLSAWNCRSVRTVPGIEGDIWVTQEWTTSNGLMHSTDGGATFTAVTGVQSSRSVGFGKAPDDGNYPVVYIYGEVNNQWGVYASKNEGSTWTLIRKNGWGSVCEVEGDPRTYGRVYVGTGGRGLFYGDLQEAPTWLNAMMMGNNWFLSSWYGWFYRTNDFGYWIYSSTHGYQWGWTTSTSDDCYLWDSGSGAWWWTSKTNYPILYDFKTASYFLYMSGTGDNRVFWDYTNKKYVGPSSL